MAKANMYKPSPTRKNPLEDVLESSSRWSPAPQLAKAAYLIFSEQGYSSARYSVNRDIPVQKIQSVGIFQYEIFSRQRHSGTKHAIPVKKHSVTRIFQYQIYSQ
jgi:hypothetical protein